MASSSDEPQLSAQEAWEPIARWIELEHGMPLWISTRRRARCRRPDVKGKNETQHEAIRQPLAVGRAPRARSGPCRTVSEEKAADEQQPKGELEAARNAVTPTAVARGQHRVRNSKRADPGVDHALRSGAQHGKS